MDVVYRGHGVSEDWETWMTPEKGKAKRKGFSF